MSRSGKQQARSDRKAAERDQQHWRGKRDEARDPVSRATYQRGVRDAQQRIQKANDTIRKG
jgi:hypothetical protein